MDSPVSVESIVESVKVTCAPFPVSCHHDVKLYIISWTEPEGSRGQRTRTWCPWFGCGSMFRDATIDAMAARNPWVVETAWVPTLRRDRASVATVYLLAFYEPDGTSRVEARIGICSQWRDREAGNINPDGSWCDLNERYWGESGPGVYPIPIEEENSWINIGRLDEPGLKLARRGDPTKSIDQIYGTQLDDVFEAWKEASDGVGT